MMLDIKNLHKYFGGIKAVDGCNFSIKQGAITALIGPNGSGKSTVFHLISQLEQEDSGKIIFNKKNIAKSTTHEIARLGISRTFQEVRLFKNLSIQDHLEIAMTQDDEKLCSSLFTKQKDKLSEMHALLKVVGLHKDLKTYVTDLSYGQRKLLDLAIALAKPHTLLMLDEPVAGVNPLIRKDIKALLKNLKKKGETILVIEHDMNFVMDLADHIIVMDAGKVIAEGKPKEIQKNKKVLEAYLGE